MREGLPFPQAIRDAPELQEGLGFYFLAYNQIATGRENDIAGPRPLSWEQIRRWCDAYRLTDDEADDVYHHISAMDDAHMTWVKSKNKGPIGHGQGHQPPQPTHPKVTKKRGNKRQRKG